MGSVEMQTPSVCYPALPQSPGVAVKSLVSRCCGALPLMTSAMLFHLPRGCEGITTSTGEGLVLQQEVVKNRWHQSVLFISARPNSLQRARWERSVNASSVFRKREGISSSCTQGGDEVLLNTPRRTDPDPALWERGSAASLLAKSDGTWSRGPGEDSLSCCLWICDIKLVLLGGSATPSLCSSGLADPPTHFTPAAARLSG